MNGSPLFTGDAGSGESEIRRWILENDWLEALTINGARRMSAAEMFGPRPRVTP